MGFFDFFKRGRSDELPKEMRDVYARLAKNAEGRALTDQALSYRNIGNYDKALQLLHLAMTKFDYEPAIILIGTTAIIKGNVNEARQWFELQIKAHANDKSFPLIELYANLGSLYHNHYKDDARALEAYKLALKASRPDIISEDGYRHMVSNVHHDMAVVYWGLGDVIRARSYAEKSLKTQPDCERCRKILQRVFVIRDCNREAIGTVVKDEDGRNSITVADGRPNALYHCQALVFAQDIYGNDRTIFSKWAALPENEWSPAHLEVCALALMHYYAIARNRNTAAPEAAALSKFIDLDLLPPLPAPLNEEVMTLFDRMFGA